MLWPPDAKNWLTGKDPDAGEDWRQEKGTTEDEMVGWNHWLDEHEFEQAPGTGDGQGSLACCSPWGLRVKTRLKRLSSSSSIVDLTDESQFSSVAQLCQLCDSMDCSMLGFSVHHQLPELAQTHVHRVSDTIQPSHSLSSPSPPAFNRPQHRDLFQWVGSPHQVAKVLEFQLQHQSFQWKFRTDFL